MKNRIVVLVMTIITIAFVGLYAQSPEDGIIAYPVPFNPRQKTLTIKSTVSFGTISQIKLNVYDVNGDKCFSRNYSNFNIIWNGRNSTGSTVAPGLYILKVEVENDQGYYGKKIIRILVNY